MLPGMEAVWGFVGVLVGAAIAGLVTIGAEIIRGRNEARLDSAKRQDDRALKREDLQRQNLIDLQGTMNQWGRAVIRALLEDVRALRTTGQLATIGEDLNLLVFDQTRLLTILTERLLDDELRNALTAMRRSYGETQAMWAQAGATVTLDDVGDYERRLIFEADRIQTSLLGPVLRQYLAGRP
jgi:hypothetical protein